MQVELAFLQQSWHKRTLKQEESVQGDYLNMRSVGHQDRPLGAQRYEEGIRNHLPHNHHDQLRGRMKWFFFDAQGSRRCLITETRYEDVKIGADGPRLGRIRMTTSPLVPKLPPMHLRSANVGGDATAHVAPVHASGNQAPPEAAGPALEALMGDDGGKNPDINRRHLCRGDRSLPCWNV